MDRLKCVLVTEVVAAGFVVSYRPIWLMPSGLKIEVRRSGRKKLINVITACVDPQVLGRGDWKQHKIYS